MYKYLKKQLDILNIPYDDIKIDKIKAYHELLIEWNKKFNLTRIVDDFDAVDKHYVDSLAILSINGLNLNNSKIIDVGTGAGIPGIPLAIFIESSQFYLLDSLNKRIEFLNEVVKQLNLSNVKTLHLRAEDGALNKLYREKFDFAIARAVAPLSTLCEYLIPFVRLNGSALCYKSKSVYDELTEANSAINTLGGGNTKIESYDVADAMERNLVVINKIKKTPNIYPRKAGIPKKSPL